MKFIGNAREIGEQIIRSFQEGTIIAPLAQVFFQTGVFPSDNYSYNNKFIIALTGMIRKTTYTGAGGYNYWKSIGRHVKSGEKAIYILAPLHGKRQEPEPNATDIKTVNYIYGFKSQAIFAYEQTDGSPVPGLEDHEEHIRNLPFIEVAKEWGISVTVAHHPGALGFYSPSSKVIGVGVKNLSTWAHELIHASDDRLYKLAGYRAEAEIIAELGGAILLNIIGKIHESDIGGCYEYLINQAPGDSDKAIQLAIKLLERTCTNVEYIIQRATELSLVNV